MTEIEMVTELPADGRNSRSFKAFVEAAKANPGKWIKIPYEDPKSSIASNMRNFYGLEAHTRCGFTYIRATSRAKRSSK